MVGHHGPYPFFAADKKVMLSVVFTMRRNNKDIDNMLKYYMDAMHQVVYVDDLQVFHVSAKKWIDATNLNTEIKIIYKK